MEYIGIVDIGDDGRGNDDSVVLPTVRIYMVVVCLLEACDKEVKSSKEGDL